MSRKGAGSRVSPTANISGAHSAYSGVTRYSYDTKNELTQETSTRNGGYTNNFGFDSAGNPTSYIGATQSFNNDNQRTGTGMAYDSNGNPTTYFGTTLTYDAENRVTQIGSALQNGYRADGLRAWKLPSGGSKIYFIIMKNKCG